MDSTRVSSESSEHSTYRESLAKYLLETEEQHGNLFKKILARTNFERDWQRERLVRVDESILLRWACMLELNDNAFARHSLHSIAYRKLYTLFEVVLTFCSSTYIVGVDSLKPQKLELGNVNFSGYGAPLWWNHSGFARLSSRFAVDVWSEELVLPRGKKIKDEIPMYWTNYRLISEERSTSSRMETAVMARSGTALAALLFFWETRELQFEEARHQRLINAVMLGEVKHFRESVRQNSPLWQHFMKLLDESLDGEMKHALEAAVERFEEFSHRLYFLGSLLARLRNRLVALQVNVESVKSIKSLANRAKSNIEFVLRAHKSQNIDNALLWSRGHSVLMLLSDVRTVVPIMALNAHRLVRDQLEQDEMVAVGHEHEILRLPVPHWAGVQHEADRIVVELLQNPAHHADIAVIFSSAETELAPHGRASPGSAARKELVLKTLIRARQYLHLEKDSASKIREAVVAGAAQWRCGRDYRRGAGRLGQAGRHRNQLASRGLG